MIYKLYPECKDYLWGGTKLKEKYGKQTDKNPCAESWELSFHKDGPTKISDGRYLMDVLSKEEIGENSEAFPFFPVLIKFIDAKDNLSVQVHPSDDYALANENSFGKTEMWYIVDAEAGAGIYLGLKKDITKEEFQEHLQKGTVEELLNFIPVKKGDSFFIEAGTLHAIGKGCLICEIQQNSNLTYRVYDYNRRGADGKLRPLHIEKALEVMNFKKYSPKTFKEAKEEGTKTLARCKYFETKERKIKGSISLSCKDSFIGISVISGSGSFNETQIKAGESYFVPAKEEITIKGKLTILTTTIPKIRYFAGIDIGGTFVKCGILSDSGEILVKDKIKTEKEKGGFQLIPRIAELVRDLEKRAGVKVSGAGIGSPSTIDSDNGIVIFSNNIPMVNVPIGRELSKILEIPVKMTNDANAAALGEYSLISDHCKNMVFLTLGTGLGSGIIVDGKLYEGYKSAGAEYGHQVIKLGGLKCNCGRRGCWECYGSTTALINQAKEAMEKHKESLLWDICEGSLDNVNGITIFKAYKEQDKTAKSVVKKYINYLSEGILNIVSVLRPEYILIGGGISAEGDIITKPIQAKINKLSFGGSNYSRVKVGTAKLTNDAGIVGAAYLIQMNI